MKGWHETLNNHMGDPVKVGLWRKIESAYFDDQKSSNEIVSAILMEINEQLPTTKLQGEFRNTNNFSILNTTESLFPFLTELIQNAHEKGVLINGKFL